MSVGKEILKVAELARLKLTPEEKERFGSEFEPITAYFAQLQRENLKGRLHIPFPCPLHADEPADCQIKIEELSENIKQGFFRIPPLLP